MISVICVFNSIEKLETRLLSSLQKQSTVHEWIAIDNRESRYESAAVALNAGARRAKGEWLVFVHQDVVLLCEDWLKQAEQLLNASDPSGWVGVIGWTEKQTVKGLMQDRDRLLGRPFAGLEQVQTVDECLLVHRQLPAGESYFDEGLEGWHAYGVEACCHSLRQGARNYVFSLPVWHDSDSTNVQRLEEAHRYVWDKHGRSISSIYTTCGFLPQSYDWGIKVERQRSGVLDRGVYKLLKEMGVTVRDDLFGSVLEHLTEKYPTTDVFHAKAPVDSHVDSIEVRAFVADATHPRRIIHRFHGSEQLNSEALSVVIMPDVMEELLDSRRSLKSLFPRATSLFWCIRFRDVVQLRSLWLLMKGLGILRAVYIATHGAFDFEGQPRYVIVFACPASASS